MRREIKRQTRARRDRKGGDKQAARWSERDEIVSMKSRVGGEHFKIVLNRGALDGQEETPPVCCF